MPYAEITGWGKALPPAVLTNDDIATVVDTSDEWITTRSGIKETTNQSRGNVGHGDDRCPSGPRRSGPRAPGRRPHRSGHLQSRIPCCPNAASIVQKNIGATRAAAFDLNAACTGWVYSLVVGHEHDSGRNQPHGARHRSRETPLLHRLLRSFDLCSLRRRCRSRGSGSERRADGTPGLRPRHGWNGRRPAGRARVWAPPEHRGSTLQRGWVSTWTAGRSSGER